MNYHFIWSPIAAALQSLPDAASPIVLVSAAT